MIYLKEDLKGGTRQWFNTVISKKSVNKSKRLPNVLRSGLNKMKHIRFTTLFPDHIKFTAEMEMIQQVRSY